METSRKISQGPQTRDQIRPIIDLAKPPNAKFRTSKNTALPHKTTIHEDARWGNGHPFHLEPIQIRYDHHRAAQIRNHIRTERRGECHPNEIWARRTHIQHPGKVAKTKKKKNKKPTDYNDQKTGTTCNRYGATKASYAWTQAPTTYPSRKKTGPSAKE